MTQHSRAFPPRPRALRRRAARSPGSIATWSLATLLCAAALRGLAEPAQAAAAGSLRKVRNLNSQKPRNEQKANLDQAALNFGGRQNELWCEGGELQFIRRMIRDSQSVASQVFWFSTLVSKAENVAPIRKALAAAKVAEVRVIEMAQGQKISRLVAWTFQPLAQQQAWSRFRWG